MSRRQRALIVDDEKAIRRFLRTTLVAEEFDVDEAETAQQAVEIAQERSPDLVVLDLGLPDADGLSILAALQGCGLPAIVVLSALDSEARKVEALDAGADDFVAKPFGVPEFMARVRAALRHRLQMQGGVAAYDDGRLRIDLTRRHVRVDGIDPKLTPREYDLLQELVMHAGKVLTHRHLLKKVWPDEASGDVQALRVHIRHLRQKIEPSAEAPSLITTEPGVGYRFTGT